MDSYKTVMAFQALSFALRTPHPLLPLRSATTLSAPTPPPPTLLRPAGMVAPPLSPLCPPPLAPTAASLPPHPAAPRTRSNDRMLRSSGNLRSRHSRGQSWQATSRSSTELDGARFVATLLQWKLEGGLDAAPCLELLQNGPFGKILAGAGFGTLPNISLIIEPSAWLQTKIQ